MPQVYVVEMSSRIWIDERAQSDVMIVWRGSRRVVSAVNGGMMRHKIKVITPTTIGTFDLPLGAQAPMDERLESKQARIKSIHRGVSGKRSREEKPGKFERLVPQA